jgi:HlyD family secretion protein
MNRLKIAWHGWSAVLSLAVLFSIPAGNTWADGPKGEVGTQPTPAHTFRTEAVKRGDVELTVHAIGTLEPEEVVDVSAQVAGTITKFGDDPNQPNHEIYWNSKVEIGTVLACIDDSSYKSARDIANINLKKSNAAVGGARAALGKASLEYERDKELVAKQAVAKADLDAAKFAVEMAKANVEIAEAQAELDGVALKQAEINLDNTRIKSPIRGTIIDRRVNIGQTVKGDLNSAGLFLIATDLTKLQIWLSVSEADIGQIRKGQTAQFTVDAMSDRVFGGRIDQVRLNATMEKNAVTYTVIVNVDNAKGELLPYETVAATINVGRHANVLMVPNAALGLAVSPAHYGFVKSADQDFANWVWVQNGESVRHIHLKLGRSDGLMTEVIDGDLKEGMQVIVGDSGR